MAMQSMLSAMKQLGICFQHGKDSEAKAELIEQVDPWTVENFDGSDIVEAISFLWHSDSGVSECYNRR